MSLAVVFDLSNATQLPALPALATWSSPSRHGVTPGRHLGDTGEGDGRELPLHRCQKRSRKSRQWRPEWENHRYSDKVEEYKTTMQGGHASLALLLTKDLVKPKESKTDSAQYQETLQTLLRCFLHGSLYFLMTSAGWSYLQHKSGRLLLLRKEV